MPGLLRSIKERVATHSHEQGRIIKDLGKLPTADALFGHQSRAERIAVHLLGHDPNEDFILPGDAFMLEHRHLPAPLLVPGVSTGIESHQIQQNANRSTTEPSAIHAA